MSCIDSSITGEEGIYNFGSLSVFVKSLGEEIASFF